MLRYTVLDRPANIPLHFDRVNFLFYCICCREREQLEQELLSIPPGETTGPARTIPDSFVGFLAMRLVEIPQ
jgi:hypothetical protein